MNNLTNQSQLSSNSTNLNSCFIKTSESDAICTYNDISSLNNSTTDNSINQFQLSSNSTNLNSYFTITSESDVICTYNDNLIKEINELREENKNIRKTLARLSTIVYTYLGEQQKKEIENASTNN